MLIHKYKEWTCVFNPTSHYLETWQKENKEHVFVSILHIGMVENGEEILDGEDVNKWNGSCENYYLIKQNQGILLRVEIDTIIEYANYFETHYT